MTTTRPIARLTLAAAAALTLAVPTARAGEGLRLELAEIAKDVKKFLAGRNETAVAVGAFTGPSHLDSSAGPAVARALAEELKKLSVSVTKAAALEAKGDYLDVVDKRSDRLAARIKVRLLDRTGTELVDLERGVFGEQDLSSLFGATAHLPPDAPPKERDRRLREGLDKPQAAVHGTRCSSRSDSPYAVEVLVAPRPKNGRSGRYQTRDASVQDGRAFVPVRRGEAYAVRLVNDSDYEAAVTLTVDGLNMFAFSDVRDPQTGRPVSSRVIIDPHGQAVIRGWHRTDTHSEEFLVTEYARSAAAELKSTADVGTITACFAACWPKNSSPPPDEPVPEPGARSADATGRGARFAQKYETVERRFGVVRDAVSVRYTK